MNETPASESFAARAAEATGDLVFGIRWLLAPMYILLYVALVVYEIKYGLEVYHILVTAWEEPTSAIMLAILDLIDMTMIANLVVMTTTGGYSIFVREFADDIQDRPRWLSKNFSSSEQKIKLIMSLIGVGAVTLLNDFVRSEISWDVLMKKVVIMGVFILCGLAYCGYNLLMHHPMLGHVEKKEDHS